ncbi:MAG: type II toxin-antitoxin system HicA family toxin [Fimbriimonas sp.]
MKVGELIKRLEADGWVLARQKGSHRHFKHPSKPGTVAVAGHPNQDLHPKTERSVRRQAGW